jgi:hypothetical protein
MIDSIVWRLEKDQFKISNELAFDGESSKSIRGRFNTTSIFVSKYATNRKKQGVYFPHIEIKKDKREGAIKALEIQASLPRLDFESSLFEVDESRLDPINDKTIRLLKEVNIIVSKEELKKAVIKRADFCKNIIIPPYFGTATQIIRKLEGFNYKQSSGFKHWENLDNEEGVKINFYNTSQGYVLYDKVLEINSNGYTTLEGRLKEASKQGRLKNNVIRFELSFHKQATFEACVRKHLKNKKKHFTLEDILNRDLAKGILLEAFDKVYQPSFIHTLTLGEMKENELEDFLISKNLSVREYAFLYYWANKAIKIGIQQSLEELKNRTSSNSYNIYKKKIRQTLEEFNKDEPIIGYTSSITGYLREEHKRFTIKNPRAQL